MSITILERLLNIEHTNHLINIDYKVPKTLEFDSNNVNKPITEEPVALENDKLEGEDIFNGIIGIVKHPKEL